MSVRFGGLAKTDPRLRQLIERSVADFRSESLPDVLRRIAGIACEIVGCAQAGVTILDPHGRPEQMISVGAQLGAPQTSSALTPPAAENGARRLIVPVMTRGRPGGELALSQPRGRENFTDDDRRAAEVLATAIGDEVERVRTATENRRRERWYTAGTELARSIATARHRDPLQVIAEHLRSIADADRAAVLIHDAATDTLTVRAVAGSGVDEWRGLVLPSGNIVTSGVLLTGTPLNVADAGAYEPFGESARTRLDGRAVLMVPMLATRERRGVLAVSRNRGRSAFTSAEVGMATMLAGQVGLALELAEFQEHQDKNKLLQERDRIARDLHDHVIQRLFALGLSLQNAVGNLEGEAGKTVLEGVDEIDATIRQIRTTIYQLKGPITAEHRSVRTRIGRLLDELDPVLGFRPELDIRGPLDLGIDDAELIDDCVAVLREALTNIARHAEATRATVAIAATALALRIEVTDNGRGIGDSTRRSGLANLQTRAERHGGSSTVSSDGGPGTRVVWAVPLTVTDGVEL